MTKELVIPIHSIVDQITNSSTMIFITPYDEAVHTTKKVISSILVAAGVQTSVDDLFDVRLGVKCQECHSFFSPEDEDTLLQRPDDEDDDDGIVYCPNCKADMNHILYPHDYDDCKIMWSIIVRSKHDDKVVDIWDTINTIFDIDGTF